MKLFKISTLVIGCTFLFVSCSKKDMNTTTGTGTGTTPVTATVAPAGFNYSTTKTVTVNSSAMTNDNQPLAGVSMNIYTTTPSGTVDKLIYKGFTDKTGSFTTVITIPAACDSLVIDPAYLGLTRLAKAHINGSSVNFIFGGSNGFGGDITSFVNPMSLMTSNQTYAPKPSTFGIESTFGFTASSPTVFSLMSPYNSSGVPLNLLTPNDKISADMLADINSALPETINEPNRSPGLFSSSVPNDLVITQTADVWITFVSEGAGYSSSLGWYSYPTSKPPASINNIDSIHFIFPNCKYPGQGGGLSSGNKVHLGVIPAGTTIGVVLFSNAWAYGNYNSINYFNNAGVFFTDSWLNPETVASLRQHTVMLQYNNLSLICFEDMNRQQGSDNDFNDVIFYATSNPVTAISQTNMPVLTAAVDTDGDGVPDYEDAFPTDPTRAYINYYPAQNAWGTVAYEDNWPLLGDYDMNDLVVSYQYKIISNAQNNVVEMYGSFAPVASGAIYNNGFGVSFPFASSLVKTVTGQNLKSGYIKTNANGTEAGQQNAVIIPFDNARNLISNTDGNSFINTLLSEPKVSGDTSVVYIGFTSPITTATLGTASFNPFAISNGRRGYEIHLPNYAPTALVDMSLFGTNNDASIPSKGIYYVTKDNHPWGLNFIGGFQYPIETVPISQAYLHFFDWAGSGGATFTDWYSNTASGYQNTGNIYNK